MLHQPDCYPLGIHVTSYASIMQKQGKSVIFCGDKVFGKGILLQLKRKTIADTTLAPCNRALLIAQSKTVAHVVERAARRSGEDATEAIAKAAK